MQTKKDGNKTDSLWRTAAKRPNQTWIQQVTFPTNTKEKQGAVLLDPQEDDNGVKMTIVSLTRTYAQ